MLMLLKYNWKRTELLFYTTLGLSVLLYGFLIFANKQWNWWGEFVLALSAGVFMLTASVVGIAIYFTFNYSLKSHLRRMIPVKPSQEFWSIILLSYIYGTVMSILFLIVVTIIQPTFNAETKEALKLFISSEAILSYIISYIAYGFHTGAIVLFSIAFARMFRTNLKLLIFVGICILIYGVNDFINHLLFGDYTSTYMGFIYLQDNVNIFTKGAVNWFTLWSPFWIDMAFGVLAYVLTIYIMKRKIEV